MQFQYFLQPQAAAQDEENMVNKNTLAATERESDQQSNEIYNKKVNMLAFYQPLTVINGIIFNHFYPAHKVLMQNVATFRWADLDVLKIQVQEKYSCFYILS